ncbi:MAG: hypothetical protein WC795_00500 [Candidatus Paceibacterota bacterium]|jgi:hypothetical protein
MSRIPKKLSIKKAKKSPKGLSFVPPKESPLGKAERQPVQYFILRAVSIGKRMSIEDLVPEVEKMLGNENSFADRKTKPSYVINRTIKKMTEGGMLMIEGQEKTNYAKLTPEGFKKLEEALFTEEKAMIPLSWNGVFQIVILNFSEDEKSDRERVRYILKKARFIPFATGAYVTIYPFPHITNRLQEEFPEGRIITFNTNDLDHETSESILKQFGVI